MSPELQLRDIHLPPEPSWWPPAPGWWVLAILSLLALALLARWVLRRRQARRRRARLLAEFDSAAAIGDPAARLAAISQLLRRAARLRDPRAAQLQGAAWLRFLDGDDSAATTGPVDNRGELFSNGIGRILLTGPYQPATDPSQVEALIEPARRRYLSLVAPP
jgi:hypothetical protein